MKASIAIQNLKCGGCSTTITNKLSAVSGVENVKIGVDHSTVNIEYRDEHLMNVVRDLLIDLGYPPEGLDNKFRNKAQSFISCVRGRFAS